MLWRLRRAHTAHWVGASTNAYRPRCCWTPQGMRSCQILCASQPMAARARGPGRACTRCLQQRGRQRGQQRGRTRAAGAWGTLRAGAAAAAAAAAAECRFKAARAAAAAGKRRRRLLAASPRGGAPRQAAAAACFAGVRGRWACLRVTTAVALAAVVACAGLPWAGTSEARRGKTRLVRTVGGKFGVAGPPLLQACLMRLNRL